MDTFPAAPKNGGAADEDYFRFHARKGENLTIDVAAARLGSPLDSVIEVLDAQGKSIPRATVRCLNETYVTLSDKDSRLPRNQADFHFGLPREGLPDDW